MAPANANKSDDTNAVHFKTLTTEDIGDITIDIEKINS